MHGVDHNRKGAVVVVMTGVLWELGLAGRRICGRQEFGHDMISAAYVHGKWALLRLRG